MAIRLAEIDAVLEEIRDPIVGAPLQKVRVPGPDRVVLTLRAPGETVHLLIVVQSHHTRLHAIPRPPPNPARSLAIQGRLRALLRGRCKGIERLGHDRIVALDVGEHRLQIELTGRHGNVFVLDREGTILASLLPNRSHRRDLQPGRRYQLPASDPPPPRPTRFSGEGVSAQIDEHYGRLEAEAGIGGRRAAALRHLRTIRKRLARKADRQLDEAMREDEVERLRREADLLNANFSRLTRGADSVEVPDVFEDGAPNRRIELDPALGPREVVERRYRKARRLERGMLRAADEHGRTEAELRRLEETIGRIEGVTEEEALEAELGELPRTWRPQTGPRRRARPGERLPYREFTTAVGVRIRVGRSGADNDELTFRHARGRDVWLHVVGRPGAHVVIPLGRGEHPDPATLEAAAQLALAHSGFAEGDDAEVAWTRVKHVRKPRNVPPGTVIHTQERVFFVRRSREALEGVELVDGV